MIDLSGVHDFGGDLHHMVDVSFLPESPFVVDAGACVGKFCLAMTELVPTCRIVAVEPSPRNLPELRELGLSNVEVVEAALTDGSSETIEIIDIYGPGKKFYQWSSVVDRNLLVASNNKHFKRVERTKVRTTTLKEVSGGRRIDYLKMDVEGAECVVLCRAMEDGVEIGQLSMEFHENYDETVALLVAYGFEFASKGAEIYGRMI